MQKTVQRHHGCDRDDQSDDNAVQLRTHSGQGVIGAKKYMNILSIETDNHVVCDNFSLFTTPRKKTGVGIKVMAKRKNFEFEATLSEIDRPFLKTAIYLPDNIVRQLPAGRVRVEGLFNQAPFALAVQHIKEGPRYFPVSAPLRKAAGIRLGDKVKVVFRLVDPDKLEMPEELEAVLAQDDEARKAWNKLPTGFRRSLIHYVTSVKNVDARIRRCLDMLSRAKMGQLHGQKKRGQ